MNVIKIIGELIGVVAIIEGFFIYYSRTREKILFYKFISDALWMINLLLLGGYTGALLNLIGMGRETVFYYRDKKKWAAHPGWLVLFLMITAVSPMATLLGGREGWASLFPAVGSILAVIAFYQRKPSITRTVGFFAQLFWLVYACLILNYSSILCNAVQVVAAVAGAVRKKK